MKRDLKEQVDAQVVIPPEIVAPIAPRIQELEIDLTSKYFVVPVSSQEREVLLFFPTAARDAEDFKAFVTETGFVLYEDDSMQLCVHTIPYYQGTIQNYKDTRHWARNFVISFPEQLHHILEFKNIMDLFQGTSPSSRSGDSKFESGAELEADADADAEVEAEVERESESQPEPQAEPEPEPEPQPEPQPGPGPGPGPEPQPEQEPEAEHEEEVEALALSLMRLRHQCNGISSSSV